MSDHHDTAGAKRGYRRRGQSMIYFARAGEDGPVKIGLAHHVPTRMSTLQGANPEPLFLLRTIAGDERTEWKLHYLFRKHHIRGEWFRFCERMLSVVESDLALPPTEFRLHPLARGAPPRWRGSWPEMVPLSAPHRDVAIQSVRAPASVLPSLSIPDGLYRRLLTEARLRRVSPDALAAWLIADGLRPGKRPARLDDPVRRAVIAAKHEASADQNVVALPPPFKHGELPVASQPPLPHRRLRNERA